MDWADHCHITSFESTTVARYNPSQAVAIAPDPCAVDVARRA